MASAYHNSVSRKHEKMKCYISNIDLNEETSSLEHVIPNALGGKLKSRNLLCKEVNSKLGETIDIALTKSIPIPSLLGIKRDRGDNPKVQAKTLEGVKYNVVDHKTAVQAPRKPKQLKDKDGNIVIEFPESQEKQILGSYAKKQNTTIEELKKRVEYKTDPEPKVIYFDNHFSVIGTPEAFRGVVKIATNFYVLKRNENVFCKQGIEFVKGDNLPKGTIQYYYPKENIGLIEANEFSHILHLKGDFSERILYCYIELFNVHNFIIVLNKDYSGPNFSETYVFDIDNQTEIDRNLNLNLTRQEILNLDCPGPGNLEDLYAQKLERLSQIKDFEFSRTDIEDKKASD